ncbi:GntR family transcriptional regulator [Aureimonas altamirensis]|uniref:GntR family transcriptional regulator n=1 Tax=Aureimonas altamirensis TaxID=370622 RepID=UPI002036B990|nr:GntR family transcriptional regulator [Aureimonas altamirensis]MCM2505295.1 GntR family transcriptional regulator [Aureimonas altamirensis]
MSAIRDRVLPLRKETLQDGVFRRLCELILEGGIAPAQSITVASLASAFEVSPMPVREALTRLTEAGALTVISGRTIGIPQLTRERLDDLRNVRLDVESTAVRWAAARADGAFLSDLGLPLDRLRQAERTSDPKLYVAANYDFHFRIYRQAGSPILLGMIEKLWLQISPYFHLLRESGNFRISNTWHQAMHDALGRGDAEAATAALVADIDGAYGVLCDAI